MNTFYDFITVGIFAGLILLFLQRSVEPPAGHDPLHRYIIAAIGCALSNFLGNEGRHFLAIAAILATLSFVFVVLKPFGRQS
jgi:hypothetical protein